MVTMALTVKQAAATAKSTTQTSMLLLSPVLGLLAVEELDGAALEEPAGVLLTSEELFSG